MTDELTFIASEVEVIRGEDALLRLSTVNDARYANEQGEVLAVDGERWHTAQQYERDAWVHHNNLVTSARNEDWAAAFGYYSIMPDYLGDVIELGAGPFTNARLLIEGRTWHTMTLIDPLILDYRVMAHCPYKHGMLGGRPVTLINRAIEDWQPAQQYDTLIMVNTLHHCRDAFLVFDRIWRALKPGGWLVWGEWPNETDPHKVYNAGHPITPRADTLESFMSKFEEVYRHDWFMIGRAR